MAIYSISAKMIKKEGSIYTYTYAIDDLELKEENSGFFTMEEEVFYNLPDDIEFLSNTVAEELVNDKIVQLKPCHNGSILGDGIDCYIIYIIELLIKERIKKDEIPEKMGFINGKRILEELGNPIYIHDLVERGILKQQDIDNLIERIKASQEQID